MNRQTKTSPSPQKHRQQSLPAISNPPLKEIYDHHAAISYGSRPEKLPSYYDRENSSPLKNSNNSSINHIVNVSRLNDSGSEFFEYDRRGSLPRKIEKDEPDSELRAVIHPDNFYNQPGVEQPRESLTRSATAPSGDLQHSRNKSIQIE